MEKQGLRRGKDNPAPLLHPSQGAWHCRWGRGRPGRFSVRDSQGSDPASPLSADAHLFSPQLTPSSWPDLSPQDAQAPCVRQLPPPVNKLYADWMQWCRWSGRLDQSVLGLLVCAHRGRGCTDDRLLLVGLGLVVLTLEWWKPSCLGLLSPQRSQGVLREVPQLKWRGQ